MKWAPDTVVALVLIVGAFCLIAFGVDGEVKSILTIAAGWIFGKGYLERRTTIKK